MVQDGLLWEGNYLDDFGVLMVGGTGMKFCSMDE
jgi:hypothetical protein